jgi:hypothetical protein
LNLPFIKKYLKPMDTASLMHFFASLNLPFIKKYLKTPRIKGKGS